MDTYAYKSLNKDGFVDVNYESELYKQNVLNDYEVDNQEEVD